MTYYPPLTEDEQRSRREAFADEMIRFADLVRTGHVVAFDRVDRQLGLLDKVTFEIMLDRR